MYTLLRIKGNGPSISMPMRSKGAPEGICPESAFFGNGGFFLLPHCHHIVYTKSAARLVLINSNNISVVFSYRFSLCKDDLLAQHFAIQTLFISSRNVA